MTTSEDKLEEKLNLVDSLLTQAKGIAREQWGNLSGDKKARLVGKKDQVVGKLKQNYGTRWAFRNRDWVLWGTAVTLFATILALILARNNNT
jgi:uncharacterized protein YjbJ (UPF0337 family)